MYLCVRVCVCFMCSIQCLPWFDGAVRASLVYGGVWFAIAVHVGVRDTVRDKPCGQAVRLVTCEYERMNIPA